MEPSEAWVALRSAELVCPAAAVAQAVVRVAEEITRELEAENPLVLSVMGGAVVFTGQLMPLLRFPLEFDYLHLTRYANTTRGGNIEWKVFPRTSLARRVVLVLDDILDEGYTMAEIRERILAAGAARFFCAVFADKDLGKPKPITPDFVGLKVPNRYVFGFGMDVEGAWRNLPEIYAVKDSEG
jgi:hypoxanthine phosphoribosyltransferase